jgi:hypothetical protein
MRLRPLVLIGACLAAAIAALAAGFLVLAGNDSAESGGAAGDGSSCQLALRFVEVEIKSQPGSGAVDCPEAQRVFAAYRRETPTLGVFEDGELLEIDGWSCQEISFEEYPLIMKCDRGDLSFQALGMDDSPLTTQAPPLARSTKPVSFQTPTGNVACHLSRHDIECVIFGRAWTPPPRPKGCTYGWGRVVELRVESGARIACAAGGVILPDGESGFPVLPGDASTSVGKIVCENRQAVVCTAESGHGFLLSFQRLDLF